MRAFSRCLFDEVCSGVTPVLSSPEHDLLLASMDRIALHAVASVITAGGTPQLNVKLQHSGDGLTYYSVSLVQEIDRVAMAATGRTDAMGAMDLAAVPLGRIRLSVSLNAGDVARVKVFVTGRKAGCGCGGACSEAGDVPMPPGPPPECPPLPPNPNGCDIEAVFAYWAAWFAHSVCIHPGGDHSASAKLMQDGIVGAIKSAKASCGLDLGPCQKAYADGVAALSPSDPSLPLKLAQLAIAFANCVSDHTPQHYNPANDPSKQGMGPPSYPHPKVYG